jgi:MFS family permease
MFAPLFISPPFSRLWLGALISGLGDGLTWIALQWLMLEKTNDSGPAVGLMLLCFGLPAMLTGAPIGRLMDRFGAVPVMIVDNLARALLMAVIPFLDAIGKLEVWHVFVIATLCGALLPASQIGIRSLVPRFVPDRHLEAANSGIAFTNQIATLGPPLLAGLLIERYGTSSALWIDACSFFLFALLLVTIPNLKPEQREVGTQPERGAWRTLRAHPTFLNLVLLTVAFYAAYGPLEAAMPVLVKRDLNAGAFAYGLLWTASGIGMLLSNLFLSKPLSRLPAGWVLAGITVGFGMAQLLMAFSPDITFVTVWMFVIGLVWGPFTGLESTVSQRLIPQALHGRIFGARQALVGPAGPLGMALGGLMLAVLSSRWVLGLSALACVIAGLIALGSPRMRNLEQDFIKENT